MRNNNEKKQSKLMYIICAPIRTLAKARNFYMRGLEDCAGKVGYGGGGVSGYTAPQRLPKSFSFNSSSSDDEDMRQLLRTASSRKNNNVEQENTNKSGNSDGNSDVHRRPIVHVRQQPSGNGMGMRSYSVGLKMGRIDEEMACTFEEDEVNAKADLYPRSRSYAVRRRNAGFA